MGGWAQGEDTETFDDANLPEWERSPDTYVIDGVLQILPGNFALHFVDLQDFSATMDLKFEGMGVITVSYSFRGESAYVFAIDESAMHLIRRTEGDERAIGGPEEAGLPGEGWFQLDVRVSGGNHEIRIDGELVFQAQDEEPLPPGALLFNADSERTLEVDNLSITITPVDEPREPDQQPGDFVQGPVATETVADEADEPTGLAAFIQQLQVSSTETLELQTFAINLLLAALYSFILSRAYVYWGFSLANRRKFAANFMLITITTTFIILVVRSSVALSLGLVGALSIVRFRAAIKEPEELAYLFFAIGLGIGLGDNQRLLSALALVAALLLIGLMRLLRRSDSDVNLHLTVSTAGANAPTLDAIVEALKAHCSKLQLVRYDEGEGATESVFRIEFKSLSQLTAASDALRALSGAVEVSYLSDRGLS
jgi:hypothetical protein